SYDMANPIKFITIGTGVLTGILLHDIGLLTIVSTTRKLMSRSMIKVSSIIAGIVLIGFSGYFVYEAISAVKQLI
nr:lysine transporter LysE [Bacilli bacterium]